MTRKFFLSVFRFNTQTDYLPYYKKHTISIDDEKSVADLLACVKEDDPLFDYPTGENEAIKINGKTLYTSTPLLEVYEAFEGELTIESLKEKRSIKDLTIDKNDFYNSFDKISAFVKHGDKEDYEKLIHLHYASEALEYNEEYIGDAFLVFAYDMIEKYPNVKTSILKIVADEHDGIWYHTPLTHRILENASVYDEKIEKLKQELLAHEPFLSPMVEKELSRAKN